jgi:hypothetical protein
MIVPLIVCCEKLEKESKIDAKTSPFLMLDLFFELIIFMVCIFALKLAINLFILNKTIYGDLFISIFYSCGRSK